jgi:hypothetical protein
MSLLENLCELLDTLWFPHFTAEFPDVPPPEYCVLVPIADTFSLQGDGAPLDELQEVRLSLFSQKNYLTAARKITKAALEAGIIVTSRTYVGYENETKFHHYALDLSKNFFWED